MKDAYGDEAESWFYSYEGWASQKREETRQNKRGREEDQNEIRESENILNSDRPDEINSSYVNQSFLTGDADLVEVEQIGQHITLKIYKRGVLDQATRVIINPKEARTLIMMLATAVEGGPYTHKDKDNFPKDCDI